MNTLLGVFLLVLGAQGEGRKGLLDFLSVDFIHDRDSQLWLCIGIIQTAEKPQSPPPASDFIGLGWGLGLGTFENALN